MVPMSALRSLVPCIAVSAFPAIFLAASNSGEIGGVELSIITALLAGVGVLLYALVRLVTRSRVSATTSGVIAALIAGVLLNGLLLALRIQAVRPRTMVIVMAIIACGITARVWWRGGHRPGIARALNWAVFATYIVTLLPAVQEWRVRISLRRQATFAALSAPLMAVEPSGPVKSPDIFILLLDNLANAEVLESGYHFSSRAFEDSLVALGFRIPATRSNYGHTAQALSAMLSAADVAPLERDFHHRTRSLWPYYELIHDDRLSRFLRERGYRTFVVPSHGWTGTAWHEYSEVQYGSEQLGRVRGWLGRSQLLGIVLTQSIAGRLIAPLLPMPSRAELGLAAFDGIEAVMETRSPKFVLAHSLAAHAPYEYSSTCEGQRFDDAGTVGDARVARAGYLAAVECTHRRVLEVVSELLRRSPGPPIIILQADHGPRMYGAPLVGDAAAITPIQAAERLGAFGAYLLPGDTTLARLLEPVTPVGIIRHMLTTYFGASLPPAAARSYYNTGSQPFRFVEVDPQPLSVVTDPDSDITTAAVQGDVIELPGDHP
jgi:hypothetical protein